jgi:hypothetical protein
VERRVVPLGRQTYSCAVGADTPLSLNSIPRMFCTARLCHKQVLLGLIVTVHGTLLLWNATRHSPTIDEIGFLAAGLNHWHTATFDLYRVNPPLPRLAATLPLAAAGVREPNQLLDTRPLFRPEFALGREFVNQQGERAFWYFTEARCACLVFSLLGGYVCFRWARELYGPASGLLAAGLWSFCPIVMGHASLITADTAAAALGTLAYYLFWRWTRQPDWPGAYWAGLGLGVALLCKTSWLLLFLLWPLSWAGVRLFEQRRLIWPHWVAQGVQVCLMLVLGVVTVDAGYLFEGCFDRLEDYPFVSQALTVETGPYYRQNRFTETCLGAIRVPFPRNFVSGIDVQKSDFEKGLWSYLGGEWRRSGWWYYYLYGLAVKWPLGTWLLLLLAVSSIAVGRSITCTWRDEVTLALPGITLFVLVSSQTGFNHHLRYILPSLPFAYIWMSRVLDEGAPRFALWKALVFGAVLWSAGSSFMVYPHSLSYFNELAGGPMNGSAHLVDSNLDWGQDVFYLKRWLDDHPDARPLRLAYFGYFDPRVAGIQFSLPPAGLPYDSELSDLSSREVESLGPKPGWFAVSVTLLRGYEFSLADGKGGMQRPKRGTYTYFQRFRPVATAGYSIFIYHIGEEECNRVRAELGLPPLQPVARPEAGT